MTGGSRSKSDRLLGIAELPGQIKVGARAGTPVQGVCKGFWFWWSREVYGLAGIGAIPAALLSNPEDNPGYPYQGEWPWSDLLKE